MVVSDRKLNFVSSEHSIEQQSNVPSESDIRDNGLSHTMGAVDLPSCTSLFLIFSSRYLLSFIYMWNKNMYATTPA